MKTGKRFCSLFPCPVLYNHTIDERLTKKGGKKNPPTAVPCHCLTGLLEVSGPPMFTKLKLSACHRLPDGRRCYVTDIRKTTKINPFFSSQWMRGWGGLWRVGGVWEEEVMHPVDGDHWWRLTSLIHRAIATWPAWVYKLERAGSAAATSHVCSLTSTCYQSSG